ncbi:MAG TPA: hypothetical protein VHN59_13010 [Chitinophagaceae bacterium]|nr:hypothetical protein [Chitinophagaceae bacterium]
MKTKTLKIDCFSRLLLWAMLAGCLSPFSSSAQANTADLRGFVNNVVEIGVSEFGFITAEDSVHIYFVTIRHSLNEKNYPAEIVPQTIRTAKFYNSTYRVKATKLREARMGAFSVALYQAPRPPEKKWLTNYYESLADKKGKLSTFRDKWVSDNIWFMNNAKIEVDKKAKNGIYTLKVSKEAGLARGMPLINSQGFVAGVIAESSLGKTMIRAISMEDIADMLYILGNNDCRYINMIAMGQHLDRCELEALAKKEAEEKAALEAERKAQLAKKHENKEKEPAKPDTVIAKTETLAKGKGKHHFLDYGISANLLGGPRQVNMPGENGYFKTKTFHAGLALYLNIDRKKGLYRITLKPGYGSFSEETMPAIWASSGQDIKIFKTRYQFVEMPVVFEKQLFGAKNFSAAFGAGYSAGYVLNHQYTWTDKDAIEGFEQKISGSAVQQRVLAELHFYQFRIGRVGLVYAQDISKYPHADYTLSANGIDYKPFAERKKGWYLGLELAFRFRGKWGK